MIFGWFRDMLNLGFQSTATQFTVLAGTLLVSQGSLTVAELPLQELHNQIQLNQPQSSSSPSSTHQETSALPEQLWAPFHIEASEILVPSAAVPQFEAEQHQRKLLSEVAQQLPLPSELPKAAASPWVSNPLPPGPNPFQPLFDSAVNAAQKIAVSMANQGQGVVNRIKVFVADAKKETATSKGEEQRFVASTSTQVAPTKANLSAPSSSSAANSKPEESSPSPTPTPSVTPTPTPSVTPTPTPSVTPTPTPSVTPTPTPSVTPTPTPSVTPTPTPSATPTPTPSATPTPTPSATPTPTPVGVCLSNGNPVDLTNLKQSPQLTLSSIQSSVVDSNGSAYFLGHNANGDIAVEKIDAQGNRVLSWANSGQFILVSPASGADRLAIDSQGNLLIAGQANGAKRGYGLTKLNPSGALDSSFGSSGVSKINASPLVSDGYSVLPLASGKHVFAGQLNMGAAGSYLSLIGVTASGAIDAGFMNWSTDVRVATSSSLASSLDLLEDPNGGFWVASTNSSGRIFVSHYSNIGILSSGFGSLGLVDTGLTLPAGEGLALETSTTGLILIRYSLTQSGWTPLLSIHETTGAMSSPSISNSTQDYCSVNRGRRH